LSKESGLATVPSPEASRGRQTDTSGGTFAAAGTPIALTKTVTLYHGDCREVLGRIPSGTIDVVIADPPYFLRQKDWSMVDDLLLKNGMKPRLREAWDHFGDVDEYLEFAGSWIEQVMRVLTVQGSLFVFGSYHCVGLINYALQRRDITMLHHIAWVKRNAKPNLSTRRLQLSNETIIWAVKSREYRFNYRATKAADYPGDYLKKPGMQMRDAWDIATASREATGHPSQKPVAVYDRILDVAGLPGGVLLDPFAGSGTAAVAAAGHRMRSILIERDRRYLEIIERRVLGTGKRRRQQVANKMKVPVDAAAD
jgi:DNA modification methylase